MYKMIFDHHTHTTFSHGKGSIEDNVKVAVRKGLRSLAITDHGPGHLTYGVKRSAIPKMREEIERLKPLYPQIDLKLGVEANTVEGGNYLDVTEEDKKYLDFVIAGYHYGVLHGHCIWNYTYKHGVKLRGSALEDKNTEIILKAIDKNDLYILTHPGDKGPFDIAAISKKCEEKGVLMEINSRHHHLTTDEIKIAMKYDVSFIISSDAHTPDAVGSYEEGLRRAREAGLDLARIVNIEEV